MKSLKAFKLIDQESYFNSLPLNEHMFNRSSYEQIYVGFVAENGSLVNIAGNITLIQPDEMKFFEDVDKMMKEDEGAIARVNDTYFKYIDGVYHCKVSYSDYDWQPTVDSPEVVSLHKRYVEL